MHTLTLNQSVFLSLPNMIRWLYKFWARPLKESIHHDYEIKERANRDVLTSRLVILPYMVCPLSCWVSLVCTLSTINLTDCTPIIVSCQWLLFPMRTHAPFLMGAFRECSLMWWPIGVKQKQGVYQHCSNEKHTFTLGILPHHDVEGSQRCTLSPAIRCICSPHSSSCHKLHSNHSL